VADGRLLYRLRPVFALENVGAAYGVVGLMGLLVCAMKKMFV
jgi:hypothetical protein